MLDRHPPRRKGGGPSDGICLTPQRRKSSIISRPCRTVSTRPSGTGQKRTDHPREVIEAALAHVVRSRVEAAYARSDLFERRRVLMDDRAGYLDQGSGEEPEPVE